MNGLMQDVRYALRAIRRAPLFSAVAIGCLAAGIGVNAAAFSALDAFLVRDLPGVERQKDISAILISWEVEGYRRRPSTMSTLDWEAFRDAMPAFENSSVMGYASVALRLSGGARAVRADFVSGDFFTMLRTRPAAGRLLTDADDTPGASPAAVISYDLWQNDYDLRQDVIGKPLYLGDVPITIVGVAPQGFVGLYPGELGADPEHGAPYLFMTVAAAPLVRPESRYESAAAAFADDWLLLAGRRRAGVTHSEAEIQANVVAAALAAQYPRERASATTVARNASTASRTEMIVFFVSVMALPLLVLLVACANLANQLLARAVHRSREIAVRLSLGATRARVVRLLLVESILIALAASVGGILLARLMTDALRSFVMIPFRVPMDLRVVLFSLLLAFVTAIAFGLVPSLRATRLDLANAIKEGANAGGYRRSRLRSALVVTQVAASVALLALAGVFVRAAQRSDHSERAENVNRVLSVAVDLDLLGYTRPAGLAFQSLAVERLRTLPGVEAVALASFAPASSVPYERITLPGDAPDSERYYETAAVNGDWFAVRDTRPLAGRLFTAAEAQRNAPAAVVDAVAARELWPDRSALGQELTIGEGDAAFAATVIGVVPTIRDKNAHNDDGVIMMPRGARYEARSYIYLRTRGQAADLRAPARQVMRDLDRRLPPADVATLAESLNALATPQTQMASGVGALGAIAMLLAALGLSAVMSFIIEQRRFEIGVRVALGARSATVVRMVVLQSLRLAALGIVLGAALAAAGATVMQGMLFGMPPIDPIAFAGSTSVILLVALLASAVPARRATRVDPLVALRAE